MSDERKIQTPGIGILLASGTWSPDNLYRRPREVLELGYEPVFRKRLHPLIEQGVETVVLDMPYGKSSMGDYPYTDFFRQIYSRDMRDRKMILSALDAIKALPAKEKILYLGCLDAPEMRRLWSYWFRQRANEPIAPHIDDPSVSFVFDASNREHITKKHRIYRFLSKLEDRITEKRVYRESAAQHEDQYGKQVFLRVRAARVQLINRPAEAFGRVHVFFDDNKIWDTWATPDIRFNGVVGWMVYCYLLGHQFSVAEHILRANNITLTGLMTEAQRLLDEVLSHLETPKSWEVDDASS